MRIPFARDVASARAAAFRGRTLSLMWRLREETWALGTLDESMLISNRDENASFIWLAFPPADVNLHPALEMLASSHPCCTKSATGIPCLPE
jgi:hypothetical protein